MRISERTSERHFPTIFISPRAVLSSSLDLLDLSEPGERRNSKDRKSPVSNKSTPHRKKLDETELIQVDIEENTPCSRTQVKDSLDSGTQSYMKMKDIFISYTQDTKSYLPTVKCLILPYLITPLIAIPSSLEKWEELTLRPERTGSRKWKLDRRRSSKNSGEFVWWAFCKQYFQKRDEMFTERSLILLYHNSTYIGTS